MSGPVPAWVPPVVRFVLALVLVFLGVRMLLDGYSATALVLGSGILTAELVGFGLTPAQAKDAAEFVQEMEGGTSGGTP